MPPTTSPSTPPHHKLLIIGSGPAGHTAAIYASRANLAPIMYEGMMAGDVAPGGQLTTTTDVENFPGFPEGILGGELTDRFRQQSERFGTTIVTETIQKIDTSSRPFRVWTEDDADHDLPTLTADAIIIATGATAKRMHIPGEESYWQAGISACAVCDGAAPIYRNKHLTVVGGGDSAAEEALFLTKYASKVSVLVRRDKLRASQVMADRLLKHPKIEVLWKTVVEEAEGSDGLLSSLTIRDRETNTTRKLPAQGLFYAIGHIPNTAFLAGQVEADADGYLLTQPNTTLTSVPGLFAAGDVQDKRYRQAITAAGSGCQAAMDAMSYLETLED
ncbi:MAG: thioredoxin reductase Trr1 [Piptocephalis tieghemiana]|nr:MAG: thioredoxin reductase Trr1 [Piptocephalis tieghemiana]